jgi:hypothetical protein
MRVFGSSVERLHSADEDPPNFPALAQNQKKNMGVPDSLNCTMNAP